MLASTGARTSDSGSDLDALSQSQTSTQLPAAAWGLGKNAGRKRLQAVCAVSSLPGTAGWPHGPTHPGAGPGLRDVPFTVVGVRVRGEQSCAECRARVRTQCARHGSPSGSACGEASPSKSLLRALSGLARHPQCCGETTGKRPWWLPQSLRGSLPLQAARGQVLTSAPNPGPGLLATSSFCSFACFTPELLPLSPPATPKV